MKIDNDFQESNRSIHYSMHAILYASEQPNSTWLLAQYKRVCSDLYMIVKIKILFALYLISH